MKLILTSGWDDGIAALTERLVKELAAGKRVLWMVSGGSNIPAAVEIMTNIPDESSRTLTVMPADERWGKPGHKDSNWEQLLQAGFDGKHAKLLPILKSDLPLADSARRYEALAREAFDANDVVIAQLGMGGDGHIAGILPGSPAAREERSLVAAYEAPPIKRLTLTFPALRRVTAAYVFAFGENKRQALAALKAGRSGPPEQPARILDALTEAYIYNDQVDEHD